MEKKPFKSDSRSWRFDLITTREIEVEQHQCILYKVYVSYIKNTANEIRIDDERETKRKENFNFIFRQSFSYTAN